MSTKKLGHQGELLAKNHLLNIGYQYITSNYHSHFGEIDLIFKDQNQTVFVEVKTRSRLSHGVPEEAVTPKKLKAIIKTSQVFLAKYPKFGSDYRIDVIAIDTTAATPQINHLKNISL